MVLMMPKLPEHEELYDMEVINLKFGECQILGVLNETILVRFDERSSEGIQPYVDRGMQIRIRLYGRGDHGKQS